MRLLFITIASFFFTNLLAQNAGCKNELKIRVSIKGIIPGDSIISYKALSNAEEIVAEVNEYQILSFTATLYPGNEVSEFSVAGAKFSENNRKWFLKLRPGDHVYFSNIRAKIGNGISVCLKPAYYRISE